VFNDPEGVDHKIILTGDPFRVCVLVESLATGLQPVAILGEAYQAAAFYGEEFF
jgi:hypothetical protein